MKDLRKLQTELEKYNGKDISIRTDGNLRFGMSIHNAKCMVTSKIVIISNLEFKINEEIEVCIDDINNVEIETEIVLQMNGNYNIYIST